MAKQTYEDWYWTGRQDFGNAGEIEVVSDSPRQELADKARDIGAYKDDWMEHNEVEDGLDPDVAFDHWKRGWLEAARAYMHSQRARPRHGTRGISAPAWIEQRYREAIETWGEHGDEAIEREVFVRDAIRDAATEIAKGEVNWSHEDNADEFSYVADEIARDPSYVRSDADPEMELYSASMRGWLSSQIVHAMTQGEFSIPQSVAERARELLQERRGTHWTVSYTYDGGDEEVVTFEEHEPMMKRNPPKTDLDKLKWAASVLDSRHLELLTKGKPLSQLNEGEAWTLVWHAEYREKQRKEMADRTAKRGADWGPEGIEAFEREEMVRYALSKTAIAKAVAATPNAVQSAYSARTWGLHSRGARPSNAVLLFTEHAIGDPFEYSEVHEALDEAVRILNRDWKHPDHEWSWDSIRAGVVRFYLGPQWRTKNPSALAGGIAAGMKPSQFDPRELARGTKVELEHTSDPKVAQRIAMDHLAEDPRYYQKLATIHNPPPRTKSKELTGGVTLVVEEHPHGISAWAVSRDGQRIPVSYGDYEPTDLEDALEAAERWLKGTRMMGDLHAASPRKRRPTYEHNSPAKCRCGAPVKGGRFCPKCGVEVKPSSQGVVQHGLPAVALSGRPRMNPVAQLEDAKAKFEEFHRKQPTKIGEFASSFEIPTTMCELGDAVHVLYRSDKKDPATGRQPKKPVDYIHEHHAGVKAYAVDMDGLTEVDVPDFICKADALVLLGFCLGFRYRDDDGEQDAEGDDPLPELYATPCGKALIVVQDKKEVLAMIWGGGLGVWARGIDG